MNAAQALFGKFNFNFGSYSFSPSYLQAGAIVVLLFLLLISLASLRRHMLDWSIKGALFGFFFGFLMALILEGFLIVGGKTALTEVLGWKNAPKPIVNAIDIGRSKLADVLGITNQIPQSNAKEAAIKTSFGSFVEKFQTLTPTDAKKVKALICTP